MPKPKFDPNKPFEVVDQKPKFDPTKPFEIVDEETGEKRPGTIEMLGFDIEPSDIGMVGGGIAGGLLGGVGGGYAGAMAGGAIGETIEESLLPDPTAEKVTAGFLRGGIEGGLQETGGLIGGKALGLAGKGAKLVGGGLIEATGIPKHAASALSRSAKAIGPYIEKIKKSSAFNVANEIRSKILKAKDAFKKQAKEGLESAFDDVGQELVSVAEVAPILNSLDNSVAVLRRKGKYDEAADILAVKDHMIKLMKKEGDEVEGITLERLQTFIDHAREMAYGKRPIPGKDTGAIGESEAVLRGISKQTRETLRELMPDKYSKAMDDYAKLHTLEDAIPASMLNTDKGAASIYRAGRDNLEGSPDRAALERVDELLGTDFVTQAEYLNVARSFADPEVLTKIQTGFSNKLPLLGAALGGGAGGGLGGGEGGMAGGAAGMLLGQALASPALATKMLMGTSFLRSTAEKIPFAKAISRFGNAATKRVAARYLTDALGSETAANLAAQEAMRGGRGLLQAPLPGQELQR